MEQAERDLEHAVSDTERGFYEWACFSSQQAAEKAVKAVFQRLGAEVWGHSVLDLLRELSKREHVPEELINGAIELDRAYIPARYPNVHPSGSPKTRYSKTDGEKATKHAKKIIEFCKGILSKIQP
jgi:HEPN domain-containing protein